MAEVVWKYPLRPWSIFLDVPEGARVLSCGAQGKEVVVWVLCDDDKPRVSRILAGHPTGTPIPPALRPSQGQGSVPEVSGGAAHLPTVSNADGHDVMTVDAALTEREASDA
jgi:hypothetical protein